MKKSSYQKIKEENNRLKQEIRTLITNPMSIEGISITARYKSIYEAEKFIFFGSRSTKKIANGIFNSIRFKQ